MYLRRGCKGGKFRTNLLPWKKKGSEGNSREVAAHNEISRERKSRFSRGETVEENSDHSRSRANY